MRVLSFFCTLLLLSEFGFAQKNFNQTWYTGGGRTFRTVFSSSGTINTKIDTINNRYLANGASSICDTSGNMLICSDGYNIYDKSMNYLDEGYHLMDTSFLDFYNGFSVYSQSSIILNLEDSIYFFINGGCSNFMFDSIWLAPNAKKAPFDRLYLSKIDMKANNGAGKVIERLKPIVQGEYLSKTQMMACKHANGKDWWLLKMMHDSVSVYTFLITKDSVYNFGKQSFPYPRKTASLNAYWENMGQI
jgi:hypothetical protein